MSLYCLTHVQASTHAASVHICAAQMPDLGRGSFVRIRMFILSASVLDRVTVLLRELVESSAGLNK